MCAIFKREVFSYFNSIIGYIFIAVMYFFAGLFFWATSLYPNNADLGDVYSNIFMIVMFLVPLLTMRIFSEDYRQKTDQLLITAPIRTVSIAFQKYFAACAVYGIAVSITLVYGIVISFFTIPDWITIVGNFVGVLVLGMTLISIGTFLSSITDSQIVAAISTYVVSLFIILMDGIAQFFNGTFVYTILSYLSFSKHYKSFTMGIADFSDIIFFVSIAALFVFLSSETVEKRRWN